MGGKSGWERIRLVCPRVGASWSRSTGDGTASVRRRHMKYVILKLLRDKPRHGYEVMKIWKSGCTAAIRPRGTVYPTLQWLEDEGLVSRRSGRQEGLRNHRTDGFFGRAQGHRRNIFDRVSETVERTWWLDAEVNRALGHLVKAVYRTAGSRERCRAQSVAEILAKLRRRLKPLATAPASKA